MILHLWQCQAPASLCGLFISHSGGEPAVCLAQADKVACLAGLMQPSLLEDGQVCVDMGPPVLDGPQVPTTLEPTQVSSKSAHSCRHPQASRRTLTTAPEALCEVWLLWPMPMAADMLPAQGRQGCQLLQGSRVVQAQLSAAGREWLVTCVSMGNPHAIVYSTADGASIRVLRTATPPSDP